MNKNWRPFDLEFIKNPYPDYKVLRESSPIFQTESGEWVITRYEEVRNMYKDPNCRVGNRVEGVRRLNNEGRTDTSFNSLLEAIQTFLVFKNPPDHTQMRKYFAAAWSDRSVEPLIQNNIEFLTDRVEWDDFDYVTGLAEPLPALTMAWILGIPKEDYPSLIAKSHILFRSFDMYLTIRDLKTIQLAIEDMSEYFLYHIQRKKENPDNSLISSLIQMNPGYTERELSFSCLFLLVAGEETTAGLLSVGLKNLADHWLRIKSADLFSMLTIDELLRFDPPIQVVARTTASKIRVGDTELPSDSKLSLVIGSANRDESQFKSPNEIDFSQRNKHLAFGTGIHHCMGDWLAKAEAYALWHYMFERFDKIEILKEPEFRYNLTFRCLSSMRISAS